MKYRPKGAAPIEVRNRNTMQEIGPRFSPVYNRCSKPLEINQS